METKISIVMPTYNGAKAIKESVKNMIAQTYTNWTQYTKIFNID